MSDITLTVQHTTLSPSGGMHRAASSPSMKLVFEGRIKPIMTFYPDGSFEMDVDDAQEAAAALIVALEAQGYRRVVAGDEAEAGRREASVPDPLSRKMDAIADRYDMRRQQILSDVHEGRVSPSMSGLEYYPKAWAELDASHASDAAIIRSAMTWDGQTHSGPFFEPAPPRQTITLLNGHVVLKEGDTWVADLFAGRPVVIDGYDIRPLSGRREE